MGDPQQRIEQQLTMLFRRAQRVHMMGSHADVELERSAYAILCRLDDEGPQRLGALASVFQLDPSTITRQVQSLERAGLAERSTDPTDRRVSLLALTDSGLDAVQATRSHRRGQLLRVLTDWSQDDVRRFADLLDQFNRSIDRVTEEE